MEQNVDKYIKHIEIVTSDLGWLESLDLRLTAASAVYLILTSASLTFPTSKPRLATVTGRMIVTRILSSSYVTLATAFVVFQDILKLASEILPDVVRWLKNVPVSVTEMILARLSNVLVSVTEMILTWLKCCNLIHCSSKTQC